MPHAFWFLSLLLTAAATQDSGPAPRTELTRLWQEQRYDELMRRVETELASRPDDGDLWIMAAEAALKLDDFPKAAASFERGIRIKPALEGAAINRGFAYLKLDRVAEARKVFEAFTKDVAKSRAAKAWYGLGLACVAEDRINDAKAAFQQAARLDPEDGRPRFRLGQIEIQLGEAAAAIGDFEAALDADELHRGAAYGLSRAHAILGDAAASQAWKERHRRILEVGSPGTELEFAL